MNINYIISEVIHNYINENVVLNESFINEKKHKKSRMNQDISDVLTHKKELNGGKPKKKTLKKKKTKDIVKNGKKLVNGRRADFNAKKERETNPNLNNQDAEDLNDILDSDFINVSAVAQEIYPDHTPQGAQSQLRKKIKGIENDNGSKYKLKKKEAYKIRRAIAKELK